MDHEPLCPCCHLLESLRASRRARDARYAKRHPDKYRAKWERANARRPAQGGPSGPLPPAGDAEALPEGPEARTPPEPA